MLKMNIIMSGIYPYPSNCRTTLTLMMSMVASRKHNLSAPTQPSCLDFAGEFNPGNLVVMDTYRAVVGLQHMFGMGYGWYGT